MFPSRSASPAAPTPNCAISVIVSDLRVGSILATPDSVPTTTRRIRFIITLVIPVDRDIIQDMIRKLLLEMKDTTQDR